MLIVGLEGAGWELTKHDQAQRGDIYSRIMIMCLCSIPMIMVRIISLKIVRVLHTSVHLAGTWLSQRLDCSDAYDRPLTPDLPVVAAFSGPGGATIRLFDFLSGHLLLEQRLHSPEAGRLFEPGVLGVDIAFEPRTTQDGGDSVYVLTNGHIIRRINANTGEVEWGWTAPDQK